MLVKDSFHDVKTSYDSTMRIMVYHPDIPDYPKAKFPGVIVYSEIYQVTGPVARFARDIAGRGYVVVAPSSYHNFVGPMALAYDTEGTDLGNQYKIEKPLKSYDEDTELCISYLLSLPTCTGRIGATGMCLGGHLAYRAALDARVSATVTFFATDVHSHTLGAGLNDDSLARAGDIKGEILLIFGTRDSHVPPEGRDLIRKTLRDASVDFSFYEVHAAQHAFIRDESSKGRYDPAVTSNCTNIMFEMFERLLKTDLGPKAGSVQVEHVC